MSLYDICKDLIIPLLAALIGGFITMAGVILTIIWERKKRKEEKIESAKPWIYSLSKYDSRAQEKLEDIFISEGGDLNLMKMSLPKCVIIIRNTSDAIGFVKEFRTERLSYKPCIASILDRNKTTQVIVLLNNEKKETLKDMRLLVADVYDNIYEYEVVLDSESSSYQIKEMENKKQKSFK